MMQEILDKITVIPIYLNYGLYREEARFVPSRGGAGAPALRHRLALAHRRSTERNLAMMLQ
jgi:hypothetical protein